MILTVGEVHLWRGKLDDATDEDCRVLGGLLDDAETSRAGRFYFERDRRRFMVARGYLRVLLGRYLEAEPTSLVFGYTERGKPFLRTPGTPVRFNVSHSGGHALFAFANGREIGVDIEAGTRLGDDWPAIARRYFSPREQEELESLPLEARRRAFLHGWARKEAYLKAIGLGIAEGLRSIEVNLTPDREPAFLSERIAAEWQFAGLGECSPPAAVVVERRAGDPGPEVRERACEGLGVVGRQPH